jgi:hypothetical protein
MSCRSTLMRASSPRPETLPLLGRHFSKVNRARTTLWFLGLLVLPTVLFGIGNTAQSIQYSHIRSELGIAKTQLDATRTQLASVRAQREQEEAAWAVERAQRAEQRQREDADKLDAARRARMHLFWDKPQRGEHCARYGAREYSARLFNIEDGYDWVTACERTPVVIHDNVIAKPDWCHVRVSGVSNVRSGSREPEMYSAGWRLGTLDRPIPGARLQRCLGQRV